MKPIKLFIKQSCLLMVAVLCLSHLSTYANSPGTKTSDIAIDGSTGVKPLVESLAEGFLRQSKNGLSANGLSTKTVNKNKNSKISVTVGSGLNPQTRIQALLDNKIDIAMASHGIDRRQILELDLKVHRIAKMAVVIAVNQNDSLKTLPIKNLSHQQLCEIYDVKLVNWRDLQDKLDTPDLPIVPLIRPLNEVDSEVLLKQIDCFAKLPLQNLMLSKKLTIKHKSGQMAKALAHTPGSIGMTTLVRVLQSNGRIKALALNKVTPTTGNLLSGDYKLVRDSYLITAAKPTSAVVAFLEFIKSSEGTRIIIANNAVPADEFSDSML